MQRKVNRWAFLRNTTLALGTIVVSTSLATDTLAKDDVATQ